MAETTHERPKGGLHNFVNIIIEKMAKHPEVCVLIIGIGLNLVANYGSSIKPKDVTSPPKAPTRFFPPGSPVLDFSFGTLAPLSDIIIDEEIIFVMYYAPWCAESMQLRYEFQKAAKVLQNKVRFIAINCWWPEGSCRNNYRFYRFPEFYVYHTHLNGFRYTGPRRADYMIKFLESMRYPLQLLHSNDEVMEFVARQDNSLIGFFDFHASPQPPGYAQFYYISMRLIEIDPLQPVRCAVISRLSIAEELGMTDTKQFVFVRTFNKSLLYPVNYNFTSSDIQAWVLKHKQQPVVKWMAPPGYKSLHFSGQLEKGPAVIMFAPVNQLSSHNYYFTLLREVGLLYRMCSENKVLIESFIQQSVKDRVSMKAVYDADRELCRQFSHSTIDTVLNLQDRNCCISLVDRHKHIGFQDRPARICEFCRHIEKSLSMASPKPCTLGLSSFSFEEPVFGGMQEPMCLDISKNYNTQEYRTLCCRQCGHEMSPDVCVSQSSRRTTDRFVSNSFPDLCKYTCRKLSLEKFEKLVTPYDVIEENSMNSVPDNFTGLSCRTNRTLNLFFFDKSEHSLFLERAFFDTADNETIPSVIIIDKKDEAHFLLRETFSRYNIASFIMNFTQSALQRHYSTESLASVCDRQVPGVCIQDLTSETFHRVVMQQDKDVILLIYATWCGFCAALSHTYIALAKYFQSAQDIVFTRINGDMNDLPWEYTVDKYPAIIVFPANRKSESAAFPEYVTKSLPNLIKFVLAHASSSIRMETAADVCSKKCIETNLKQTRLIIIKLRRNRNNIVRRIKSVSERRDDKGIKEPIDSSKGSLKVLWKIMNDIQRKIKRATQLQSQLSRNQGKLSKDSLDKIVSIVLKKSSNSHDEL